MAKSKKNRVTVARRPRVPTGHARIELIVPMSTSTRIAEHCHRTCISTHDFLKKAIYDALPVHYEVTEDWVFPFGKYAGETAGTVLQLDPGYIGWCRKNIAGFMYMIKEEFPVTEVGVQIGPEVKKPYPLTVSPAQCDVECTARGLESRPTQFKYWGYHEGFNVKDQYVLIATRDTPWSPWVAYKPEKWLTLRHA